MIIKAFQKVTGLFVAVAISRRLQPYSRAVAIIETAAGLLLYTLYTHVRRIIQIHRNQAFSSSLYAFMENHRI